MAGQKTGLRSSHPASAEPASEPGGLVEALRREVAELRLAVQARDDFISVAAHELRNPMTPLIAQIDILRRIARQAGNSVPPRLASGLDRLDAMAARYIRRATTLLDISRLTAGQFQLERTRADAATLVRDAANALTPYADLAGCRLHVDVAESIVGLWDRLAIEQITDNLVSNAIKYAPGKPISVTLAREGGNARLSVADQGPGISPADQARIFERFERAVTRDRVGGFGVGLWVVGRLIALMGGDVSVESEPGRGSTFIVRLPIQTASEEP